MAQAAGARTPVAAVQADRTTVVVTPPGIMNMDAPLIAMLVALGIFLVLTIVGLSPHSSSRKLLPCKALQSKVDEQLTGLTSKQQETMELLAAVESQSQNISEGAARLTGEFQRLSALLNEVTAARARLRNPFSSLSDF